MRFSTLGKFLLTFLFSLSLLSLVINLTLYQSTSYENARKISKATFEIPEVKAHLSKIYSSSISICEVYPEYELNLSLIETNLLLPCKEFVKLSFDDWVEMLVNHLSNSSYYAKLECDFIECLLQGEAGTNVLLTKTANDFFLLLFLASTFGSAFSCLFLTYLYKGYARLRVPGITLTLIGLSGYIGVMSIISKLAKRAALMPALGILTAEVLLPIARNFLVPLVVGILTLALSLLKRP
jgi:hypothetical protein